jgi:hypothetical protein
VPAPPTHALLVRATLEVARDLRPTLAVRFVQLSELSVTRTGREEEKGKRASAEVRSRRKKKLFLHESRRISENETKRAAALKTSFFDGTAADR